MRWPSAAAWIPLFWFTPHTKHWAEKDILTLVREADLALYRAKCLGRNLTVRYEPEEVRKFSPFADRMEGSHA